MKYIILEKGVENIECDKEGKFHQKLNLLLAYMWELVEYLTTIVVDYYCNCKNKLKTSEDHIELSEKHSSVCYTKDKGSSDSIFF